MTESCTKGAYLSGPVQEYSTKGLTSVSRKGNIELDEEPHADPTSSTEFNCEKVVAIDNGSDFSTVESPPPPQPDVEWNGLIKTEVLSSCYPISGHLMSVTHLLHLEVTLWYCYNT